MGYSGLTVQESDNAADDAYNIGDMIAKQLKKNLKHKDNEYNTSGPVNVAMFLDEVIIPSKDVYRFHEELCGVAKMTITALQKELEELKVTEWEGSYSKTAAQNKRWHIRKYERLIRRIIDYFEIDNEEED